MAVSVKIEDQEVLAAFARLTAVGRNPTRVLQAMGRYGKSSTQLRFRNQIGPDYKRWKPSKRVEKSGGQTLRNKGILRNSIQWQLRSDGVEWGTNVKYAAAHQFGIDDRQNVSEHYRKGRRKRTTKSGAVISFPVRSHQRHMKLTARPSLGINSADKIALLGILRRELQGERRM